MAAISIVSTIDLSWTGQAMTLTARRGASSLATASATLSTVDGVLVASTSLDLTGAGAGTVDLTLRNAAGSVAWIDTVRIDGSGVVISNFADVRLVNGSAADPIEEPLDVNVTGLNSSSLESIGSSIIQTANSPSSVDSRSLRIVRGDSYDGSANPVLSWSTIKDLQAWTGLLTIRHRETNAVILQVDATATSDVLITATITATESLFPLLTTRRQFGPHPYDVQFTLSGAVYTVAKGVVVIETDITFTE